MHSTGKMRNGVIGGNHSSKLADDEKCSKRCLTGTFRKMSHGHILKNVSQAHFEKCSRAHFEKMFSWAHADGVADLLGVEVVVDQAVNDGGQLGLHQCIALLLNARP